jgi:hypothetical protein
MENKTGSGNVRIVDGYSTTHRKIVRAAGAVWNPAEVMSRHSAGIINIKAKTPD